MYITDRKMPRESSLFEIFYFFPFFVMYAFVDFSLPSSLGGYISGMIDPVSKKKKAWMGETSCRTGAV